MSNRFAKCTMANGSEIIINLDRITSVIPQTDRNGHFCLVTFEKDHEVLLQTTFAELENLLIVE